MLMNISYQFVKLWIVDPGVPNVVDFELNKKYQIVSGNQYTNDASETAGQLASGGLRLRTQG